MLRRWTWRTFPLADSLHDSEQGRLRLALPGGMCYHETTEVLIHGQGRALLYHCLPL